MPEFLFAFVIFLFVAALFAVATRNRAGEVPHEAPRLDTRGPDDR